MGPGAERREKEGEQLKWISDNRVPIMVFFAGEEKFYSTETERSFLDSGGGEHDELDLHTVTIAVRIAYRPRSNLYDIYNERSKSRA